MKASILGLMAMICSSMFLLSACAGGSSSNAPSLGAQAPQTGRVPSAGNIRATQMNQSTRMTLPTAQ